MVASRAKGFRQVFLSCHLLYSRCFRVSFFSYGYLHVYLHVYYFLKLYINTMIVSARGQRKGSKVRYLPPFLLFSLCICFPHCGSSVLTFIVQQRSFQLVSFFILLIFFVEYLTLPKILFTVFCH